MPLLRVRGHDVYTPTLTGMGERSHLIGMEIDLDTHIRDVVNVLEFEDLTDVILVGHSYAGCLLPGIAVAASQRLHHLVWLDAMVLNEEESMFECLGIMSQQQAREALTAIQGGDLSPLEGITDYNSDDLWCGRIYDIHDDDLRNLVKSKLTGHPLLTILTPLNAPGFDKLPISKTYISCTKGQIYRKRIFPRWVSPDRAAERGWSIIEVAAGHDLMVDNPELLADVLNNIADKS